MHPTTTRYPFFKGVWSWLATGNSRPAGFGWYHVLRAPTPWSGLPSLYRIIMARRRTHPVPLLYVCVIVLGLVAGIIMQFTLGFPWWIPPLALFVIAWLFFFSTIWWPRRGSHTTPLREDILRVVNPMWSRELEFEREASELRDTPLRLFRPLALEGRRPHLGMSRSGQRLESLELTFFNADPRLEEAHAICEVNATYAHPDSSPSCEDRLGSEVHSAILGVLMSERVSSSNAPESEDHFAQCLRETDEIAQGVTWEPSAVNLDGITRMARVASAQGLSFTAWELPEQHMLMIDYGCEGYTPVAPDFTEIIDREPLIEHMRTTMAL